MKTHARIITIAAALVLAPLASAKRIASENFDSYTPPGSTLVDGRGGRGNWKSPWMGQKDFVTITNVPEDILTFTLDNGEVRGGDNALKISGPKGGGEKRNILGRRIPAMNGPDLFVSLFFKIRNDDEAGGGNDGKQITETKMTQWFAEDDAQDPQKV